jgi:hypothetical protein
MTLDGKRRSSGLRSDQYKQTINELSSILNSVIPKKKKTFSILYDMMTNKIAALSTLHICNGKLLLHTPR